MPADVPHLVFIYGPAAAGKLTVGRELARLTGLQLFHNHLVVDALLAVFPFGSPPFVALREEIWLGVFREAAKDRRSLVFTFAPEKSVAPGFPERAKAAFEAEGGRVGFVRLEVTEEEQEWRLGDSSRAEFRKLRSVETLRKLREEFREAEAKMPEPDIAIDTTSTRPAVAARRIAGALGLPLVVSEED